MSLKATSLKNNESQKKEIKKQITTILQSIDNDLKIAHEQGKRKIIYTLPITFGIPYMTNADAQRQIYYGIIVSLKERDFFVELELKKNSATCEVTWLSPEDQEDIELQNTIVAKHTKKIHPED